MGIWSELGRYPRVLSKSYRKGCFFAIAALLTIRVRGLLSHSCSSGSPGFREVQHCQCTDATIKVFVLPLLHMKQQKFHRSFSCSVMGRILRGPSRSLPVGVHTLDKLPLRMGRVVIMMGYLLLCKAREILQMYVISLINFSPAERMLDTFSSVIF